MPDYGRLPTTTPLHGFGSARGHWGALHPADIAWAGRIAWLSAPLEQAPQMTTITFDLPEELGQRMTMAGENDWPAIGSTAATTSAPVLSSIPSDGAVGACRS
jgi:hypothetical protein